MQLFRLVGGDEGVDEFVEGAVHDAVDLIERQADAVVGDAALGEVVGADLLAAVANLIVAVTIKIATFFFYAVILYNSFTTWRFT